MEARFSGKKTFRLRKSLEINMSGKDEKTCSTSSLKLKN